MVLLGFGEDHSGCSWTFWGFECISSIYIIQKTMLSCTANGCDPFLCRFVLSSAGLNMCSGKFTFNFLFVIFFVKLDHLIKLQKD